MLLVQPSWPVGYCSVPGETACLPACR